MEFKDVLKKLMKEKNITSYKLGLDTGIIKQSIMRYLSGDNLPGSDKIITLANYFNVSSDYLLTGKGEMLKPTQSKWDNTNERFNTLYCYLRDRGIFKSADEFAELLGVDVRTVMRAILGDKEVLTETFFDLVCSTISKFNIEINIGWLNKGTEPMIHGENYTPEKIGVFRKDVHVVPQAKYRMVEFVDLRVAAGRIGGGDVEQLPESRKRLIPIEFDNGNYLVIAVDGDSMDDGTKRSISDRDEVLVSEIFLSNGDDLPIRNKLFIITSRVGHVLKQITEVNREEGYLMCHSFNPVYEDFKMNFSDILQIFMVHRIVHKQVSLG